MVAEDFIACPIRQVSTIRLQTSSCLEDRFACVSSGVDNATHQPNVSVNYLNSAIGLWHQEFGMDDLLNSENYTVLDTQPNGSPVKNAVLERIGFVTMLGRTPNSRPLC